MNSEVKSVLPPSSQRTAAEVAEIRALCMGSNNYPHQVCKILQPSVKQNTSKALLAAEIGKLAFIRVAFRRGLG